MDWESIISTIQVRSGMRNIDIVRYIRDCGVICIPSQITRLSNGRQMDVGYELGNEICELYRKVNEVYYGLQDLESFGAKFNTGDSMQNDYVESLSTELTGGVW